MVNYDSPTATDSVDDSVDVTCVPASGTVFNEGRTRVTCTATDDSGNTVNTTFNVDVIVFNTTIFFDNFEDGNLDGWFVSDHDDIWRAGLLEEDAYPPDHPSTNKVAQAVFCDVACYMDVSGIDLSAHNDPEFLQFYRYVDDSLDAGAYLQVEVYNGISLVQLDRWTPESSDHDDIWHLETYSMSDYTDLTDFGIRFTANLDAYNEVVGIDDVRIFAQHAS